MLMNEKTSAVPRTLRSAERCAAEPGPYQAQCSLRSRFSEAALREELRAASRPGNDVRESIFKQRRSPCHEGGCVRSPDAAQREAVRCRAGTVTDAGARYDPGSAVQQERSLCSGRAKRGPE